jgi:hypothetical protein
VLDDRGHVDDLAEHRAIRGLFREKLEQVEVSQDFALGAWALHLDDRAGAIGERCLVNLADRPGSHRLRFDAVEDVFPRHSELLLHHLDHLLLGQRRDVVLECGQLLDELGRQQVGTG